MKTAIYIEDGVVQLVITPESEFEKQSLRSFSDKSISAKIMTGSFYDCRGGWVRQQPYYAEFPHSVDQGDQSLILRADVERADILVSDASEGSKP